MISEKEIIDFLKDNKFEGDFVDDANYITRLTPEDLAKAILDKIKEKENQVINCDDCLMYASCEYSGLGISQCKHFKKG